ncbi:DUF6713 family protein [Glaciecola siphonariae]|uniref:DUF6713 family protein n=1 Tax=Glaciecola siphonariae TaxID=521012 RepID=A0ABV9M1M1_9ALTE
MKTILYYLGLAALFTHELDAVLNMEWRLLFHLRVLPDAAASSIFIALHLPLFFAFFYFGHHKILKIRERFRLIVAVFLVIHSGLHFNLSDHELYQFNSIISNAYIYGAALCGLAFIILSWIHRRENDA